jgi:hypothetical protein
MALSEEFLHDELFSDKVRPPRKLKFGFYVVLCDWMVDFVWSPPGLVTRRLLTHICRLLGDQISY